MYSNRRDKMFNKKNENEYEGGNFTVRLRNNETSEGLIKRHLKKLKKENLVDEMYNRSFFKKPTTKKREKFFKSQLVLQRLREKEKLDTQSDD